MLALPLSYMLKKTDNFIQVTKKERIMLLTDLLNQDLYRDARILTNNVTINRNIRSVMVVEAIDIEKWATHDQVLLTSYFAFRNKSKEEIINFFKTISKIGIAAIMIKLKRCIDYIPEFFIQLCNIYKVPLIEVPSSTSYESIILSIHEPILNYDSLLLRSYYNASKILNKYVHLKFTYDQLLSTFADLLSQPFSISIQELKLVKEYNNFNFPESIVFSEIHVVNDFVSQRYTVRHYPLVSSNNSSAYYLVVKNTKIFHPFELFIKIPTSNVDHALILMIEKFIEVLTTKLDSDYYRKNEIFLQRNKTLSSIFFGIVKDEYELNQLLEGMGFSNLDLFQVILISLPKTSKKHDFEYIVNYFQELSYYSVYYESNYTLVFLLNVTSFQDSLERDALKNLHIYDNELSIYLSKPGSVTEICKNFSKCLSMKEFNDTFKISPVLKEDELGIFEYLISMPSEKYYDLIPNNLRILKNENPELFETLQNYLINNLNYELTAKSMFLHPKTIRYRLNKVKSLLKIDFNNSVQLTNLTVGCILLTIDSKKFNKDIS